MRPLRKGEPDDSRKSYFVQSFNTGRGGNFKADTPIACKSETGALRTAERLALSKLGVVAFSSTGDPEMGDYDDEPTVIFRKGRASVGLRLRFPGRGVGKQAKVSK